MKKLLLGLTILASMSSFAKDLCERTDVISSDYAVSSAKIEDVMDAFRVDTFNVQTCIDHENYITVVGETDNGVVRLITSDRIGDSNDSSPSDKNMFEEEGYGETYIPLFSGCLEAKQDAKDKAEAACLMAGNEKCVEVKTYKKSSVISKFKVYFLAGTTPGRCRYLSIYKPTL